MTNLLVGFEAEFILRDCEIFEIEDEANRVFAAQVRTLDMFDEPDWSKPNVFYLTEDSSIEEESDEQHGAELILPPMPVDQSIQTLSKALEWIREIGFTNRTCSLHVNVSGPSRIDPIRLVDEFDDERWLKVFDRHYTTPYVMPVAEYLGVFGMRADSDLLPEKITSINFHNDDWVEFKHIGNSYYEFRWPLLMIALETMLMASVRSMED
jgi:hypothetical protein